MKKTQKMKKLLTLAAMLSTSSMAVTADADSLDIDAYYSAGPAATSSVADDTPVQSNDIPSSDTARAADMSEFIDKIEAESSLQPVRFVGDASTATTPAPVFKTASYGSGVADCGCQTSSCDCATPACSPCPAPVAKTDLWLTTEALLWFPEARAMPALVTSNPTVTAQPGNVFPELDVAGTTSVYGGDDSVYATPGAMDGGMSPGFRLDGGAYVSDGVGIGGRFWWLGENETDYDSGSPPTGDSLTTFGSLGRPFYDVDLPSESSVLINFDNDTGVVNEALPSFVGSVTASTSLDMYGAEAYGRLQMLSGKGFRAELIGGYSYFGIDDELSISSTSIQTNVDAGGGQPLDSISYSDQITAENSFQGGQIGMETILQRSGWTIRALTKVHLGNMNQDLVGVGSRTENDGGVITSENIGFFTYDGYSQTDDVFTFAPEINLKLGYQFRDNVSLSVGYSFLYWDSVAMVGQNLNNVLDGRSLSVGSATPASRPNQGLIEDSIWVQGVDLGCIVEF
ncbi:MAG: BBP7 family outer membrane beta-barrel protein [Planctomycetota bacterium]